MAEQDEFGRNSPIGSIAFLQSQDRDSPLSGN
jgi:hypothetical protein